MSHEPPATELVARVYPALATGDRPALQLLLAPEFTGRVSDGMPAGAGFHEGAETMIDDGWWAIGRAFAVRAEPEEIVECSDGRVLVLGHYRGHSRATGDEVDAAFTHLWSARDGLLTGVVQVTDTVRWGT